MAGCRIEQGLSVLDMNGISMSIFNKRTYGLIQLASKIGSDYYPEIMGTMFIVNSPLLFTGVWAIIKGFLDEKTRNKIKIYRGNYQKDLLEMVDAENLPEFLGGKCTCAGLGGCNNSNAGPWNDFEMVKPIGIKRKMENSPIQTNEDEEESKQ